LSALGAFAEGRRHGEEALRLATLTRQGASAIVAHGCLGLLYLVEGSLEHAIRVLDQGLALCRASGNQDWLSPIMAGLGSVYALQGRLAEGRTLVEEAIGAAKRAGALYNYANGVAWLSEVCRLAGRWDEAWQHARQALDLARQLKDRGCEAFTLHQLGVIETHTAPSDAMQAEAHCHRGLGTLYAKIDRREQARTELSTAIEMYRLMEMTFWLPQAEAVLAQVEGR